MANSQTITATKLEGRVAQILNARELVINIGSEQGVKWGMKFAVLAEQPVEVRDPNTNELLDTVDREKVKVEVAEVREKITICRTYRVQQIEGNMTYVRQSFMAEILGKGTPIPPREEVETLRASDSSLPPPLSEHESYVKINDRVIQIAE